nr:relaxin-3 isoform X1 [Macaca nemestrina]XP_011769008.1 relaxin-3 isoform X1 [Macaca nemestrina]XP_011769062.1 relaxin-3 isoform X1 [Macaca nemestrina]XP_011769137.1 relaxin-3 isoform X1 [Macaca nemestrina]
MYKWGAKRQRRHWPTRTSKASLSSMARYTLLLLLAAWVLTGELWPGTEARAAPYGVKLCGREFIRAVIFTCGGSRWRRSDILAHETMGEAGERVDVGGERVAGWVPGAKDRDERRLLEEEGPCPATFSQGHLPSLDTRAQELAELQSWDGGLQAIPGGWKSEHRLLFSEQLLCVLCQAKLLLVCSGGGGWESAIGKDNTKVVSNPFQEIM